ncbi:hypothetical protein AX16_008871 [Volvariella volvacea WC 439]|nr:hypothetical protein AX16_008871 [Volvariella volvacea WC 439]
MPEITAYELRSLVLDYLCHNCYTNTAKAFAQDSSVRHLDADGDEIIPSVDAEDGEFGITAEELKQIELRERIRVLILSGRVDEATDLLNTHFPAVLSPGAAKTWAPPQRRSNLFRQKALEFSSATSLNPIHLLLNLRILAFIEATRTVPLEYRPHNASDEPEVALLSSSVQPSLGTTEPPTEQKQLALLSRAQKLNFMVKALQSPADRALYQEELRNVAGLLAYTIPETSPLSRYLSQERREAVADQINSAILASVGQPPVPSLELMVRNASVVWAYAHEHNIKPRPTGLYPPSNAKHYSHQPKGTERDEIVPPFDLEQFLNSKA